MHACHNSRQPWRIRGGNRAKRSRGAGTETRRTACTGIRTAKIEEKRKTRRHRVRPWRNRAVEARTCRRGTQSRQIRCERRTRTRGSSMGGRRRPGGSENTPRSPGGKPEPLRRMSSPKACRRAPRRAIYTVYHCTIVIYSESDYRNPLNSKTHLLKVVCQPRRR